MIVGRENERKELLELLEKDESQFCAVYGRRRVGKTYLIRETFENQFAFYHTGIANVGRKEQLAEFRESLRRAGLKRCNMPKTWFEAFHYLSDLLKKSKAEKKVVFIDELPEFLQNNKVDIATLTLPKAGAEAVAGVATGAIAQGALVADQLGLPFSYVRPKPKDHGMGNQIEGEIEKGAKVVVVEDLISTGGSSLKAVAALREYGVEVVGMVASFTYGFPVAEKAFEEAGVKLITLSNYEAVVEEAAKTGYIKEADKAVLAEWRKSPETWKK